MANNLGSIALGSKLYEKRVNTVAAWTNAEMAYYVMAYDVTHGYKTEFAGFADFSNSNAAAFNSILQNVVEQVGAANMDANFHYTRNVFNQTFQTLEELQRYNALVSQEYRWRLLPVTSSAYHMNGADGIYNVKYVSPDGHSEAVYARDGYLDVSDINMGTYNFFTPSIFNGHGTYDVSPYNDYGNTFDDPALGIDGTTAMYFSNLIRYSAMTRAEMEAHKLPLY